MGGATATTDATGKADITQTLPCPYPNQTFTATATDADGNTSEFSLPVTLPDNSLTNESPDAGDDQAATEEEKLLDVNVLANDADPDGDALTITQVNPSKNAQITINPDNTLHFVPNANFYGSDSFIYTVSDGKGGTATATVQVDVTPVNDAPTANSQSIEMSEDTPKLLTLSATDVEDSPLTYRIITAPAHGTLSGTAPNLIYTPAAHYSGTDAFTFKANDGALDSNEATVSITVEAVNTAPTASGQSTSTSEDTPIAITLAGADADGDPLTYQIVTQPEHGTLTGTAPDLTYTPGENYNGSDSFTFKVNDGTADSTVATVTITVQSVNDAPSATSSQVLTLEDTAKEFTLVASDADNNALTYTIVGDVQRGTLTGIAPNLTYSPQANYNGTDSLKFKVSDGRVESAVAVVTFTISAVNDAPTVGDDNASAAEDSSVDIAVLANDTDAEGDVLSMTSFTQGAHGTVAQNADGT